MARLSGVIVTGFGVIDCARVVAAGSLRSASVRTASRPVKMPTQVLLVVDHEHRAGTTLPHAPAGLLHRLAGKHERRLILHNVCELTVRHAADTRPTKISRQRHLYFAHHTVAEWVCSKSTSLQMAKQLLEIYTAPHLI